MNSARGYLLTPMPLHGHSYKFISGLDADIIHSVRVYLATLKTKAMRLTIRFPFNIKHPKNEFGCWYNILRVGVVSCAEALSARQITIWMRACRTTGQPR